MTQNQPHSSSAEQLAYTPDVVAAMSAAINTEIHRIEAEARHKVAQLHQARRHFEASGVVRPPLSTDTTVWPAQTDPAPTGTFPTAFQPGLTPEREDAFNRLMAAREDDGEGQP